MCVRESEGERERARETNERVRERERNSECVCVCARTYWAFGGGVWLDISDVGFRIHPKVLCLRGMCYWPLRGSEIEI